MSWMSRARRASLGIAWPHCGYRMRAVMAPASYDPCEIQGVNLGKDTYYRALPGSQQALNKH